MTEDGLVDADAIAVLLNIPRDTVLDLARRQLIPSYRFWRKLIRFDKAEVCTTADDKLNKMPFVSSPNRNFERNSTP